MKYFWIKIEDKYDWFEYIAFAETEKEAIDLVRQDHDGEFEVLDCVENEMDMKRTVIQSRQGCD